MLVEIFLKKLVWGWSDLRKALNLCCLMVSAMVFILMGTAINSVTQRARAKKTKLRRIFGATWELWCKKGRWSSAKEEEIAVEKGKNEIRGSCTPPMATGTVQAWGRTRWTTSWWSSIKTFGVKYLSKNWSLVMVIRSILRDRTSSWSMTFSRSGRPVKATRARPSVFLIPPSRLMERFSVALS